MINLLAKPCAALTKVFLRCLGGCILLLGATNSCAQHTPTSFDKFIQGGKFNVGTSYGALNGIPFQSNPYSILYTEGSLNLTLKRLPFKANYYVSNAPDYGGRRNSFSIQFDAPKLKQLKTRRISELKQKLAVNIDSLKNLRHDLGSRLAYYQFSDQFYHRPDSLGITSPNIQDSLGNIPIHTTLPVLPENLPTDSLNNWLEQYQNISEKIEEYKKYQSEWEQLQKAPKVDAPQWKEAFRLQNLKSFQIGAASPDYSMLTVQGNRIIGLAISSESEKIHLDFATGFLRSSYSNTSSPMGIWEHVLPLDMFRAPAGKLIAGRIGYGQINSSHIYVGYTGGKNNIIEDLFTGAARQRRSQVIDLSTRVVKGSHSLDLTLAQRLNTSSSGPQESDTSPPISRWFHSALNLLQSSQFEKLDATIESKVSWIGPGYFSIGAPFLLSDNARFETKVANQSWRYFQPSISLKHQYNDVLDQYDYQNQISIAGLEVTSKILNSWTVRLYAGPAISRISNEGVNLINRNYVYQVGSSFMRQTKNFTYNVQLSVGKNLQLWDTLVLNSDQANVLFGLSTKSGFTTNISILHNRFDQNGIEMINFSMLDWQCGLPINKGTFLSAGASLLQESGIEMGAFAQLKIALGEHFEWTLEARRFVWPSFNTDFAPMTGIRIPYLLNTSIQYTL